jgi:hypothetical protein
MSKCQWQRACNECSQCDGDGDSSHIVSFQIDHASGLVAWLLEADGPPSQAAVRAWGIVCDSGAIVPLIAASDYSFLYPGDEEPGFICYAEGGRLPTDAETAAAAGRLEKWRERQ